MSKNAKGFCMFFDWVEDLDQLGDSDGAWQIVKALSEYFKNGKNPVEAVTGPLRTVAAIMLHQIKRSEMKAAAGRKGAEVTNSKKADRQSNAFCRRHTAATETETITETISYPGTITKNYNISIPESENAHTPAHEIENVETDLQTFGKFANVYITAAQYDELCAEYGATVADELINRFSGKLQNKGYKYDDHFLALKVWAIQDGLKPISKNATSYDVDEFFLAALSATENTLNETR